MLGHAGYLRYSGKVLDDMIEVVKGIERRLGMADSCAVGD